MCLICRPQLPGDPPAVFTLSSVIVFGASLCCQLTKRGVGALELSAPSSGSKGEPSAFAKACTVAFHQRPSCQTCTAEPPRLAV